MIYFWLFATSFSWAAMLTILISYLLYRRRVSGALLKMAEQMTQRGPAWELAPAPCYPAGVTFRVRWSGDVNGLIEVIARRFAYRRRVHSSIFKQDDGTWLVWIGSSSEARRLGMPVEEQ